MLWLDRSFCFWFAANSQRVNSLLSRDFFLFPRETRNQTHQRSIKFRTKGRKSKLLQLIQRVQIFLTFCDRSIINIPHLKSAKVSSPNSGMNCSLWALTLNQAIAIAVGSVSNWWHLISLPIIRSTRSSSALHSSTPDPSNSCSSFWESMWS